MSLGPVDIAQLLTALTCLLAAAHVGGFVLVQLRQPRVVGEIVGGFLLGPTVLGALAPGVQRLLLPADGSTAPVLAAVYQLGLLLLMFCSGAQVRTRFAAGERRTALAIATTGTILPFAAALGFLQLVDPGHMGPAQHQGAFVLVFAIAMAVTSIPVISRIMLDLGILETPFARIVLGAAVLEDVLLYVVLSVALGLAGATAGPGFGVPGWLGLAPASGLGAAYHVLASLGFFGLSLVAGPWLYARSVALRLNWLHRSSPTGSLLVYLMIVTALALVLGVAPMLGAFVAGMIVGRATPADAPEREAIQQFSFAFFVPLYFALVGFRLDLRQELDLPFFAAFLGFACVIKALSVYVGARAARESHGASTNLALAMNARGGPAIVLASVAHDAGIIDGAFYVHLVILAVVTSSMAGAWLQHTIRRGRPLR